MEKMIRKAEINWGIPLDRSNGAKPVTKADQIIFYYVQPTLVQEDPIPASVLILDPEKIDADKSTLSIEGRRRRIGTLNQGHEILTAKYLEHLGPSALSNPQYSEYTAIIVQLIHNLSSNQFYAKLEARDARFRSPSESPTRRLVEACA